MYEWDEAKRLVNLRKHGVDFEMVEGFEWQRSITYEDTLKGYGEQRQISIGPVGLTLYVLIWTEHGTDRIRVISFRLANRREKKKHEEEF